MEKRMSEKKKLMEKAYTLGFEYEKTYRGCAQCSFAALQDALDLRNPQTDAIFKSASGLSGGVGSEGDGHCGAYSGAVMLMGYIVGRERDNFADPQEIRKLTDSLAQALHAEFIEAYGNIICHGIHRKIYGRPFYLRDTDEKEKFDQAGAHTEKCPAVVGDAARWAVKILYENGYLKD
jgi:C_GCAxxG_C_C family probable redox protein